MSYVNSVCESMTTFCQGETMTVHKQPCTWHVTCTRARASPDPSPAVSFPKLKLKFINFLPVSSLMAPLMLPNEICWQRNSAPAGSQNIGLVVWEAEEGWREGGKKKAEEGDDLTQSLSAHWEASWIFMLVSLWGLLWLWWNSVLTLDLEEYKQWWWLGEEGAGVI